MNKAVLDRFCEDLEIGPREGKRLIKLVNTAANAQENEHNNPKAKSSERAIGAVEAFCRSHKISVTWPGLYPLFKKNGKTVHLPE